MKFVVVKAGINIDIYGAYSCRPASTSSVKYVIVNVGFNIDIYGAHSCRSASTSIKSVRTKAGILTLMFLEHIAVGQLRLLQ